MQGNPKRRVVWQDIKPAKRFVEIAPKKPNLLHKIKKILSLLFKPRNNKNSGIKPLKRTLGKILLTIIIIVILIILGEYWFLKLYPPEIAKNASTAKQQIASNPVLKKGTPSYPTVLPTNKNINTLGGWTRVSPAESDPVFAYKDKIGTSEIIVSQQPLPSGFKTDTFSKIEQLAQGFNANEKITVGSLTIFLGTSKDGPQSIIFNKNNLLILIKSNAKIANNQWADYINSLQ